MERSYWKKHYLQKIPRRQEIKDTTELLEGRLLRFETGLGGLQNESMHTVTRLLESARNQEDSNAFLGLLEALIDLADQKPPIEQLLTQTDAMILFLLGMDVPEEAADAFTHYSDPTAR